MKKLFTILILFASCFAEAQTGRNGMYDSLLDIIYTDTVVYEQCDSGYKRFPCLPYTNLRCAGDCVTDSVYEELYLALRRNECEDDGGYLGLVECFNEGCLNRYNHLKWNDSTKECAPYPQWYQMRGNKWVNITEEEYNKIEKSR